MRALRAPREGSRCNKRGGAVSTETTVPPSSRTIRPGKQVQLAENEIRCICLMAKEIFMSQPALLELEAPIKICGRSLRARCQHLGRSSGGLQDAGEQRQGGVGAGRSSGCRVGCCTLRDAQRAAIRAARSQATSTGSTRTC